MIASIKDILIKRDGLSAEAAQAEIELARADLYSMIESGDPNAHNICADWFGLEPDYLEELIF